MIASAIDRDVRASGSDNSFTGMRFVDDYTISFNEKSDAENYLRVLNHCAAEYNLSTQESKSRIDEVKYIVEEQWPHSFAPRGNSYDPEVQKRNIVAFFTSVTAASQKDANESIISYAIKMSVKMRVPLISWPLYEAFLLRLVQENVNSFDVISKIMCTYAAAGATIRASTGSFLSKFLVDHCQAGHAFEVSWCIWLLVSLKMKADQNAVKALGDFRDPICTLMALHAHEMGLLPGYDNNLQWLNPTSADLYGPNWPLICAGSCEGWLKPNIIALVDAHPLLGPLKRCGVRFYLKSKLNKALNCAGVGRLLEAKLKDGKTKYLKGNIRVLQA